MRLNSVKGSDNFLEFCVNLVVNPNDRLLPVTLSPFLIFVALDKATLLTESTKTVDRHIVHLLKILANFWLGKHVIRPKAHSVIVVFLGRAHHKHFLVKEVDLLIGSLEPRGDCRFDAFWVHIFFEVQSRLIVLMQLGQRVTSAFHGRFKFAKLFSLEVADLLRISPVEVELLRVKTKSPHFLLN